jgi:hypothetical protein
VNLGFTDHLISLTCSFCGQLLSSGVMDGHSANLRLLMPKFSSRQYLIRTRILRQMSDPSCCYQRLKLPVDVRFPALFFWIHEHRVQSSATYSSVHEIIFQFCFACWFGGGRFVICILRTRIGLPHQTAATK